MSTFDTSQSGRIGYAHGLIGSIIGFAANGVAAFLYFDGPATFRASAAADRPPRGFLDLLSRGPEPDPFPNLETYLLYLLIALSAAAMVLALRALVKDEGRGFVIIAFCAGMSALMFQFVVWMAIGALLLALAWAFLLGLANGFS